MLHTYNKPILSLFRFFFLYRGLKYKFFFNLQVSSTSLFLDNTCIKLIELNSVDIIDKKLYNG